MPEPKRLLKVFLCHAHADTPIGALRRNLVWTLYTRLTKDGVDAFVSGHQYEIANNNGQRPLKSVSL